MESQRYIEKWPRIILLLGFFWSVLLVGGIFLAQQRFPLGAPRQQTTGKIFMRWPLHFYGNHLAGTGLLLRLDSERKLFVYENYWPKYDQIYAAARVGAAIEVTHARCLKEGLYERCRLTGLTVDGQVLVSDLEIVAAEKRHRYLVGLQALLFVFLGLYLGVSKSTLARRFRRLRPTTSYFY